jgi:hypothetical protein
MRGLFRSMPPTRVTPTREGSGSSATAASNTTAAKNCRVARQAIRPMCGEVVGVPVAERLDGFQRKHRWAGFPLAVLYRFGHRGRRGAPSPEDAARRLIEPIRR